MAAHFPGNCPYEDPDFRKLTASKTRNFPMTLAIQRVKVYLRTIAVALVVGAVGLVLFKNRTNYVEVWFFGLTDEAKKVNVVWLMLSTALGTLTAWRVVWFTRGLWRDMREVARLKAIEEADRQHKQRAAELEERERRIEEKLKRAAASDGESGMKE